MDVERSAAIIEYVYRVWDVAHSPVTSKEVAAEFNLSVAQAAGVLAHQCASGRLSKWIGADEAIIWAPLYANPPVVKSARSDRPLGVKQIAALHQMYLRVGPMLGVYVEPHIVTVAESKRVLHSLLKRGLVASPHPGRTFTLSTAGRDCVSQLIRQNRFSDGSSLT